MADRPEILLVAPWPAHDVAALRERFTVHDWVGANDREALVQEVGPRVRAIATRGEKGAEASLMRRLPKLEIISCFSVGYDAIDFDYTRAHGIRVTNTPDVLTDDVADMAMALLLAAARRIPHGDAHVRAGAWSKTGPMPLTRRFSGKRVGIVGLGRIGRAVARRCEGFGCEVAYSGRTRHADAAYAHHADPASLAAWADFLVVCTAGGPATRGLVGRAALDALGPEGILVNIARGSVIDEAALLDALRERRIAGAGLDVFASEPDSHPDFNTLENVVLQPHHASGTTETRAAMGKLACDNLVAHFEGRSPPAEVA